MNKGVNILNKTAKPMTMKGKIFMCTTFLFLGLFLGGGAGAYFTYHFMKSNQNKGNQVTNHYDIKAKNGSVINTESNSDQEQEKSKSRNKKNK